MMNTAKLFNLTQDALYKTQFDLLWQWFYGSGMLNDEWLINDGLAVNAANPEQCANNHGLEWSYNQGVILGGLSAMEARDENFFNISSRIIRAVMRDLTSTQGILHEQVPDDHVEQSGDASQFKGIWMRYLMYWFLQNDDEAQNEDIKQEIVGFVKQQMTGIVANSMNPMCFAQFSAVWNASWIDTDYAAVAQASAIDLFNWAFIL